MTPRGRPVTPRVAALVLAGACCACGGVSLCVLAATSPQGSIEVLGSLFGVWSAAAGAVLLGRARCLRSGSSGYKTDGRPVNLRPVAAYSLHPARRDDLCGPPRARRRDGATRSDRRVTTISSARRSRA